MEIERKFLITKMPSNIDEYDYHIITQGYLCQKPVVRVRREDDNYYMTYKGEGLMVREEYNLPLTKEAFDTLVAKSEGNIISKKRVIIPYKNHTIELDIFDEPIAPLVMAEVEFDSKEEADKFEKPDWFAKEVTEDPAYHNVNMIFKTK